MTPGTPESEVTIGCPGFQWDPTFPQPLIKAAAATRAAMTTLLVDLHPVAARRVLNEADVAVVAGTRPL